MDDPYRTTVGGDPHPIVTGPNTSYVQFGSFGTMDPDINSNRIQSWNFTVEQQIGSDWGVSAAYLGSHSDRLWYQLALNPGIFMGLGPCTLNGVVLPGMQHEREPEPAPCCCISRTRGRPQFIGPLDLNTDIGWQNYHGIKLAAVRRAVNGISLNANYTLSQCTGHSAESALQPDERGLPETGRSVVRRGLLRPGSPAPGLGDGRLRDSGLRTAGAARDRLALALLGHRERAFGRPG